VRHGECGVHRFDVLHAVGVAIVLPVVDDFRRALVAPLRRRRRIRTEPAGERAAAHRLVGHDRPRAAERRRRVAIEVDRVHARRHTTSSPRRITRFGTSSKGGFPSSARSSGQRFFTVAAKDEVDRGECSMICLYLRLLYWPPTISGSTGKRSRMRRPRRRASARCR
jgi:hypothetical protein